MAISNSKKIAYVQVLAILNRLSPAEYQKIPTHKIDFYEKNQMTGYQFAIDESKPILLQLTNEAKIVLAHLFIKYVATEEDRKLLYEKAKNHPVKESSSLEGEKVNDILQRMQEEAFVKEKIKEEVTDLALPETWFQRFLQKLKKIIKKG